jgi:hypothetical protein
MHETLQSFAYYYDYHEGTRRGFFGIDLISFCLAHSFFSLRFSLIHAKIVSINNLLSLDDDDDDAHSINSFSQSASEQKQRRRVEREKNLFIAL